LAHSFIGSIGDDISRGK